MLRNLLPDLDQLLNALFFVALLLYLIPAAFRSSVPKKIGACSNSLLLPRSEQL
jgi:hypothetical protein